MKPETKAWLEDVKRRSVVIKNGSEKSGSGFIKMVMSDDGYISNLDFEENDDLKKCVALIEKQAATLERAKAGLDGYVGCRDGCTCGDGWAHEGAEEALKELKELEEV